MSQPLLPWESENINHPNLIWRAKLDNRYLAEVHRTDGSHGKLLVFDHDKNDQEIACWEVSLSYGAICGPDVADVNEWEDKVQKFIDDTYSKQQ